MEDKWKRMYEATGSYIKELEAKVLELATQNTILTAEKKVWELEKMSQQKIIQQTLDRTNALSNKYLEENRGLREELVRLRNGDKRELANESDHDPKKLHDVEAS